MKILVFSDSHGVILPMRSAIRKEMPDAVIFLGDVLDDIDRINMLDKGFALYSVKGNNDIFSSAPSKAVITLDEHKIFATHGHLYRNIDSLAKAAEKNNCDICLFGHTHTPLMTKQGGITIMNPGSIRDSRTFGIIENGECKIIYLSEI